MIYRLPYGGKWHVFSDRDLLDMSKRGDGDTADFLLTLYREYERNHLAFFLPHGGVLDLLNDWKSDFHIVLAGKQRGKTIGLLAWLALRTCKCDKHWPLFQDHGVICPEWTGPKHCALATYRMGTHAKTNLWPKIVREMFPVDELRKYSSIWAKENGAHVRRVNWKSGSPMVELGNGSTVTMYSYEQGLEAFTSSSYDAVAFDEQPPEDIFDEAFERGKMREHYQTAAAMTPHKIPGNPWTGGGGWVHQLYLGSKDKGIDVRFSRIDIEDVPDAIMSAEQKADEYERNIAAPERQGNARDKRRGRSNYYGEFEVSEGLVYDNWDPTVHVIDPIEIQPHWTLCRSVDHGRVHPWAGLCGAVTERGDLVLYREFFRVGASVYENVRDFVAACGNELKEIGQFEGEDGSLYKEYREVYKSEEYDFTVLDGRSFKRPTDESVETLGELYIRHGLDCTPASGMHDTNAVPIVREWFDCSEDRPHILEWLQLKDRVVGSDGEPLAGSPRIYVFRTLSNFRREIAGYMNRENDERPVDHDNDLMTALKYMILAEPRYLGSVRHETEDSDDLQVEKGFEGQRIRSLGKSQGRFVYHV